MFKILCTKFPKTKIIKQNNTNFLLNKNISKNFSLDVKKTNFAIKDSPTYDFYESNFKLEQAPDHMPIYNDLDTSFASEVFNNLDMENLTNIPFLVGKLSRLWCLSEDTIHHFVMYLTHELNLGIGFSTIILASFMRLVFFPFYKKSNKNAQLSRLIHPDVTEIRERVQKLNQAGDSKLAKIESAKITKMQKDFGIKNSIISFALSFSQALIFVTWTGLVQRFSYNVEDYPELMTGGFFWFRDLSMTDPYLILPLINSIFIGLNAASQNTQYSNIFMLKARRFLFIIPLISFPTMCTLETGIIIYFLVNSGTMLLMNFIMNSNKVRKTMALVDYLPGSKLERLNRYRLVNEKLVNDLPNLELMKESKASPISEQSAQENIKKTTTGQSAKKDKTKESSVVASLRKKRK